MQLEDDEPFKKAVQKFLRKQDAAYAAKWAPYRRQWKKRDSPKEDQSRIEHLEKEVIHLKEQIASLINDGIKSSGRAVTLHKPQEEAECQARLAEAGITNFHVFPQSLTQVLEAITEKEIIDNVLICEEVVKPHFRFYTKDEPTLSLSVSNAMAQLLSDVAKPISEVAKMGRQARTDKADEFAVSIYETVQSELGNSVKSFRDAARLLQEKEIPTPSNNGKWYAATVIELNKRWERLGLNPLVPQQK